MIRYGGVIGIWLLLMTSLGFAKDPFEPVKLGGRSTLPSIVAGPYLAASPAAPIASRKMHLTAIIWDVNAPSVLFESDGRSQTAEVGDQVFGATVARITAKSVSLNFKGKHFILKLGQDMPL